MENISFIIIKKLVALSNLTMEEDDIEVYVYGFVSYLYTLFPLLILFSLSIFFHKPIEMLTWIITFLSLRKYSGGYHAKTPTLCFIYSILLGLSSLIICTFISTISLSIYFMCILVNYVILFFLTPATNKQFTHSIKIRCKIKITLLLFVFSSIYLFFSDFQSIFLHALFCTSFLCVAQKMQKC